jgi:co-chaperonin GroES (HSP10)
MKTVKEVGAEMESLALKHRINKSGFSPCGDRVVVLPDKVEQVTKGGIIIPEKESDKHQLAQVTGVLVAVGPDSWKDRITTVERVIDGQLKVVERRTTGYSGAFAQVGDRVCFARYGGLPFDGEDGLQYRLLNDEDITATVSESLDLTEFRKREPLGAQG